VGCIPGKIFGKKLQGSYIPIYLLKSPALFSRSFHSRKKADFHDYQALLFSRYWLKVKLDNQKQYF